jgi:hypothetical protein
MSSKSKERKYDCTNVFVRKYNCIADLQENDNVHRLHRKWRNMAEGFQAKRF